MADLAALPVLPLAENRHIALAVSGGSDSTALLHLAVRQCRSMVNPPEITAITVDHRLRSGSTAEARAVESMCAALGVRHMILAWEGAKPSSGIQDAARNARRNLIAAAAVRIGADAVFTGHTLDDQLETVAMRQKRGHGPGIAGIAPASFVFNDAGAGEPVLFKRPMLETSRPALRDFLQGIGTAWIEDPSNENVAFERVAIRQALAAAGPQPRFELHQMQKETALERTRISKRIGEFISAHGASTAPGLLRIDYGFAQNRSFDETRNAFRVLQAFAAGLPALADEAHARAMSHAASAFAHTRSPSARYGSGGVLTDLRKQGVYLMQEQRRGGTNPGPFSGRYRLTGTEPATPPPLPKPDPVPAPASLIRKAAVAEPIFDCPYAGASSCHEACRDGKRLRLLVNPWPDLVPSFDLPAYNALAEIIGARQIDSPLL
jgi:tRNA(Ile)-lysidine synthase